MLKSYKKPSRGSYYNEEEHQEEEDEDHFPFEDSQGEEDYEGSKEWEEYLWNKLHIPIVEGYISNLSTTCDFPEVSSVQSLLSIDWWDWNPHMVVSFKKGLKDIFVVPRLNKLHQNQNRINKFQLVQAFLSFLLQLLYHKSHPIENLEKELRFLLTILGDISWMLVDSNVEREAEFTNLLTEFEAVANQTGSLVHYLFFSADPANDETDEGIDAVLKHINLLNANLQSSVSTPAAFTTQTTSIVDSILILDSLVDDLEDLLKQEDDPIPEIKDQVNLLHQKLLHSQSLIKDVRSPQPSGIGELKEPLMRIGGIAHQAEYLITSFLVKDAPPWYVLKRLTHLNQKIEPIRTNLQLIIQKYRFGGLKVTEYFSSELPLHDRKYTEVNDVTVGFEDITRDILDQLVGGGTQSLQVISILGMPGLGKTTLAKKLYNHPLVNYTFDKLSWSVVSQTYKRQSILANILIHINSELEKDKILEIEEETLVERIHKTLMGRRYLIVLDDVWDSSVSDELLRCFPDDVNGSRILLTSRNKYVAPPNSIIHELPFLSDEQCWELLEKKVFGSTPCPLELQGIGKNIAANSCGLPLTLVVIAGVLSSVDEEESTWKRVGGSLASYTDNSVMQILELSYKHLSDHLKPCFLYFGEFEEDEEISVGNLKRLWVAEGFIRKEKDKSAEKIAGEYLVELIEKSMVMIAKIRTDGRGAKSCVVHDLLRDLCLKKSKEESFLKYLNNNYRTIYEKGHRVRANGESATLSYCQHVRSFVGDYLGSAFYVRDMRLLRVLHFKIIVGFGKSLAFGIEYLINLKYLVIDNLPTWIDTLVNLEYLRVETSALIVVYLPPAIEKMKKLRYLCALTAKYSKDWKLKKLRYQTNNLEYLSKISINDLADEVLLKCSPHLRKLKCIYNTRGILDKSTHPHFDLCFLTQLDSLSLFGDLRKKDFGFPSNIRKLTLGGSFLRWEKMSIVGRFKLLEVLKLSSNAFVGKRWDTRDDEFQKLKFLQLEYIKLSEWNVDSNEHFPKLQQLILISCSCLQEIPGEIGEITTLELIKVKYCLKSLVESAERIKEEQRDMGNEDLRVIISDEAGHW